MSLRSVFLRQGLLFFIVALFLSPFLYLVLSLGGMRPLDAAELQWALLNSLKQAFLSAALGCSFGLLIAMGLNRLEMHSLRAARLLGALLLLPSVLPPFFVLLTFLSWMQPFPFGLLGIVVIQFPMMAGFAGVLLQKQMNDKLGDLAAMAQVFGAGRWHFWRSAFSLFRREIFASFAFLFVWAFTNFSIPFVVGGGRGTTLEILIYEKVRIANDWGAALTLSLLQSLLMGIFLFFMPSTQSRVGQARSADLLRSRFGLGVAVLFAVLFVAPWLFLSWSGWASVIGNESLFSQAGFAALTSFRIAAIVSLCSVLSLLVLCGGFGVPWFLRFFQVYFPPSVSLMGLVGLALSMSLLDFAPEFFLFSGAGVHRQLIYAGLLCLLFVPTLFRLGLDARLTDLSSLVQVARSLGAGPFQIYRELVLPRVWPRICSLSALAALWSVGDFALAKFFFESGETLPLLIENLMASYRVDPALSLGHVVFLIGAIFLFLFWRIADVFDT